MALPSSSPPLPGIELPSSPPLLRFDSSDHFPRKHHLSDHDSLSSDPIFSDDASSTSAEDHSSCPPSKRKRLVKGPWWSLSKRSRKSLMDNDATRYRHPVKKSGVRNVDSGVWMGSDSSDGSVDSLLSFRDRIRESESVSKLPRKLQDPESLAAHIVDTCVETCNEAVDLSDIGLTHLAPETVRSLHQLIRPTHLNLRHPPSEYEFSPLTPSIKLFLASNKMATLPDELFDLENLTVLSVRGNELSRLPSSLGRLKRLTELNIAGNRIRYLPWEVLELLRSRGGQNQISVRPNPLVEPTTISGPSTLPQLQLSSESEFDNLSRYGDSRDYIEERRQRHMHDGSLDFRGELELRLRLGRMLRTQHLQEVSRAGKVVSTPSKELVFLASSDIRYFTVNGTLCRTGAAGQSNDLERIFRARLEPVVVPPPPFVVASKAPSLFELATKSIQRLHRPHHIDQDLPEYLPEAVASAMERAARAVKYGNEVCSTCGQPYITVRAEWMEFWFNGVGAQRELTQESVLPFLRKACSWSCAKPTEIGEFTC